MTPSWDWVLVNNIMSSLASKRMKDGFHNEERLTKDLRKLDISSTSDHPIVDIHEDDVNNPDGHDKDTEISYLCPGADTSRRHGADTAPVYGLISDEESSLKR